MLGRWRLFLCMDFHNGTTARMASILKTSGGFNVTPSMEAQTSWAIYGPPMHLVTFIHTSTVNGDIQRKKRIYTGRCPTLAYKHSWKQPMASARKNFPMRISS